MRSKFSSSWVRGLALCLALAASAWPAASRAAGTGPSGTITLNVCTLPSASATQCYTTATLKLSANYFNCVWLTNPTELVGCTVGNWTSYVWLGTSQRYLELRTHTGGQPDGSDASRTAGTLLDSELAVAKAYNLSPSIAFAAPANGATVLGGTPIVLAATASDPDGGISKVEFWRDSTKLGDGVYVAANNRYEYSWSGAATGSHSLRAIAYDNVSAPSPWASLSISVNYPPQANLNAPAPNTTVQEGAIVAMQAGASDPDSPLAKVELLVDGVVVATKTASPYTHNWTAVGGSHVLTAKAYDQRGPVATSNAVPITVNRKPSAWISSPAANANVPSGQPISLTASVSDPDAGDYISQVEFYTATTLIARLYSPPFTAAYNNAGIGAHDIYVRAFDARGGFHEAPAHRINVTQLPPNNVSLTSHANNATIQQPGNVTLTGHAHDPEGQAMTLRFYDGTTLIGADASAPYAATWSSPSAGTHSLRVEATDAAGATTVSASVSVYVNAPPSVTIEAPLATPARSFGQPVDIVVAASDSDGIQKVELFGDSTKLTEVTASADGKFRHAWTNVAAGSRTLRARAWDQRGGYRDASVTFRVNTVPNVSITAPTGAPPAPLVGSNLTIQAGASDDGTVTQVDFYIDGALRGSDYGSPYAYSWAGIPAGTHQLVAKAKDNDGAWGTSATVTVFVNTPPVATLGVSSNPIEFGLPLTLTASGTDATGEGTIKLAEILDGDTVIASAPAATVSVTRSNLTRGVHALSARVTDRDDAVHRSAVTEVTILQQSPTVSLNLTHEQRFLYGPNIPISATASDPDGSIQKVEFFDNGTWFGTATTGSPYSVTWQIPSVGRRTITALATDNEGGTKMSAPVTIIVNAAPALTQFAATPVVPLDGSVALSVRAIDPDGGSIKSVRFLRDGVAVPGTVARSGDDYSMQWTGNPYGTYSFVAEATDDYDTVATSAPKTVKVNRAPTGQFVGDVADGWVQYNSDVLIAVDADDADGSVSVVEFYVDGTPLGTAGVSSGVAQREWPRVGAGTREVKAVIVDSDGARTTITTQVTTNVPPAVALAASPATGLKEGDDLTLTATVSDHNGGVVAVKFYEGETLLGEASSTALPAHASGTVSYTVDNVTRGSHTYTARARDERGSETPSDPVTVSASQPGPTIVWKQPTPERPAVVYGEQALFSVDATDPDGVASVTFVVDGMMRATDYAPANGIGDNHFVHIEPPRLGLVPVYAIGLDTEDAVSESNRFDIKVHRRPIVHVVSPEKDAEFESGIDAIDFQITVTDDYGVESIYVKHPGATFIRENPPRCPGSTDTYCISSRSDGPHDGVHYIEVRATDVDGAESRLFRQRYCVGVPCEDVEVTLVSPLDGEVRGPGPILLAADISTDSVIDYVEFYDGNERVARVNEYPWEFVLPAPANGEHSFQARAFTSYGFEARSNIAKVIVDPSANPYPTIELYASIAGRDIGTDDSVLIAALADDDERVVQVAFYAQLEGEAPILIPHDFPEQVGTLEDGVPNFVSWTPTEPGNYRIYATATDNEGAVTRSARAREPATVVARKNEGGEAAVEPEQQYAKRLKAQNEVAPLTSELFGENVSLYNGATEFTVTDVDLPGTGLPVRLQRRLKVEDDRGKSRIDGFGDWELDVPYIYGTFTVSHGWTVGSPDNVSRRCSARTLPKDSALVFELEEIWNGNFLHLPGSGDAELLKNTNPHHIRKTGGTVDGTDNGVLKYPWITNGLTRISCLPRGSVDGDADEGFIAETADGTRYEFRQYVEHPTTGLKRRYLVSDNAARDPTAQNTRTNTNFAISVLRSILDAGGSISSSDLEEAFGSGGNLDFESDSQSGLFGKLWVNARLARKNVYLLATRVEDRHGNSVAYDYDSRGRLQSITASDGRSITLRHDGPGGRVSSVTAGSGEELRTWTYEYTSSHEFPRLQAVHLPTDDATPPMSWRYTYAASGGMTFNAPVPEVGDSDLHCVYTEGLIHPTPQGIQGEQGGGFTYLITHPSGAVGQFDFGVQRHFRALPASEVAPTNCKVFSNFSSRLLVSNYFDNMALVRKELRNAKLPTQVWSWNYHAGGGAGLEDYACTVPPPGAEEDGDPLTEDCGVTKNVTIGKPDGTLERLRFGVLYNINEGKLLEREVHQYPPDNDPDTVDPGLLRKTTYVYGALVAMPDGVNESAASLAHVGESQSSAYDPMGTRIEPLQSVTIEQDDVAFSTTYAEFDKFGRPALATEASTHGDPVLFTARSRQRRTSVEDKLSIPSGNRSFWHLGLPTSVQQTLERDGLATWVEIQGAVYDGMGRLEQSRRNGRLEAVFGYHDNGNLEWVRKAGRTDRQTTFTGYHRGLPTLITMPDATQIQVGVNEFGDVTSVQDQLNRNTSYVVDLLGRTTHITYPRSTGAGENTWQNTTITYEPLAAGLRRVETTGRLQITTDYDGLYRPVTVQKVATGTGAQRIRVDTDYDFESRVVFTSYPTASTSRNAKGTRTRYDALGRVLATVADVESDVTGTTCPEDTEGAGKAVTKIDYESGLRTVTRDPRCFAVEGSFAAWGEPTYDFPTLLYAMGDDEEIITTEIVRDDLGLPLEIKRSGEMSTDISPTGSLSRYFAYDEHQRLCARIEPETGWTVFGYNALNELTSRAAGMTSDFQKTCAIARGLAAQAPDKQKVSFQYDTMGRLEYETYADEVKHFTYYDDGALETASIGDRTRTYHYNSRSALWKEELALKVGATARQLDLEWHFNDEGHVAELEYPSGMLVEFQPDAFGNPTLVKETGSNGLVFAQNVQYHPTGGVAGFTYGNNVVHAAAVNDRGLPSSISDLLGSTAVYAQGFKYDRAGNPTEFVGGTEPRTMGYDGFGRLASVTATQAGTHSEVFDYDSLDNLTRVDTTANGTTTPKIYNHNDRNRLVSVDVGGVFAAYEYDYNERGDVKSRVTPSGAATLVFNDSGRLASYDAQNAANDESYLYDAKGLRVLSTRGSAAQVQMFASAGAFLHLEDDNLSGGLATEVSSTDNVQLAGRTIAKVKTVGQVRTVEFLHHNLIGTPVVTTNSSGGASGPSQLLNSFGAAYDATAARKIGFTGHQFDDASGLNYMQQRYYDAQLGRFLSPDPVAPDAAGNNFNRYWYANNSPYALIDPDGRTACDGISTCRVAFEEQAVMRGEMTQQQKMENDQARGAGALIAIGLVGAVISPNVRNGFINAGVDAGMQTAKQMAWDGKEFDDVTIDKSDVAVAGAIGVFAPSIISAGKQTLESVSAIRTLNGQARNTAARAAKIAARIEKHVSSLKQSLGAWLAAKVATASTQEAANNAQPPVEDKQ